VVHADHGVAKFEGIVRRDLGEELGTREFLKLGYAGNDKLFIPVASAEKITKFLGDESPKLTRLGASDWQQSQKKLRVEAEKIAKELLKLYASRELAKGKAFQSDDEMMKEFNEGFPYELTPGQFNAWNDVRIDLETPRPMDRLVCGDVGFGKTEIAMRAAFKTFRSGMQAVILAPITILAEQHWQSFQKRIAGKNFGVEVALLSRFQSVAEQKDILKKIELGLVDIVIGTHRLLSEDIKFKNLGLIVVDEEQRFGVKQKEKLKRMRAGVDVLTMTATPIPRTLNMSLNKLKDISTITTPPPGRLPVVTEVRKYNLNLIRERILFETERGGQVYFLHNEVRSIDGLAKQLEALVPEVKFLVAHGQLKPEDLEQKVRAFKNGEAQVLIASTIIENGIDLANANTLIVSRAEKFGLAQLYQLRGRVGRGRTQAYAFFLYHGQKLALEAKKRLRAIVEANELGSGFQIAMRDLEIRGAGEVLGVNQAGAIKNVGVSHFMRMLNKTVDQMRRGEITEEIEETENITVEIPLSAYIPGHFIPNTAEKIRVYQELASAETKEQLDEMRRDLRLDFGMLPLEVENLCRVIRLKMVLREVNLLGIKINRVSHKSYEVVLRMGNKFTPDQIFGLVQKGKYQWTITAMALKLKMEQLPVNWYDELLNEIELLMPVKK
jgi:transcription-repair coupling factor (superfamily II helicase)